LPDFYIGAHAPVLVHSARSSAPNALTISGLRNKDLRKHISGATPGWTSRCLKRLRLHGLIKRVGKTYKYYLTDLGRRVVLTGLKLREMVV